MNESGQRIGRVTSGTMSPFTSKAIGLGYVDKDLSMPGTTIYIGIRNNLIPATVVKPPFIEQE